MPTWFDYEREADEIDEIDERRARWRERQRRCQERKRAKQNPLSNLKCKCGKPAKAIINGKTFCSLHLTELKGEKDIGKTKAN